MTEAEELAYKIETGDFSLRDLHIAAALLRSQAAEIERLKAEIDDIKQVEFPRRLRNVTKPLIEARDHYQRAADDMAAAHKVERDALIAERDEMDEKAGMYCLQAEKAEAELEAVRKANIDCVNHYDELRAELEAIKSAEPVGYFYQQDGEWKQAFDLKFKDAHTPFYSAPAPKQEPDQFRDATKMVPQPDHNVLLRQALESLEFHQRMTRPITSTMETIAAIKKELK